MLYECDQCGSVLPANSTSCSRCGKAFDRAVPSDAETGSPGFTARHALAQSEGISPSSSTPDLGMILGLLGSAMLLAGVFTPVVSMPVVGSLNYFRNGHGDGSIVLVLAAISASLVIARIYYWLWLTGAASLSVLIFSFLNLQTLLSTAQQTMSSELSGNPFRGLADVMASSIQSNGAGRFLPLARSFCLVPRLLASGALPT